METLTQVNNEGCVDHASSILSLSRIRGGGLKVKKFAARSFMATILVASTLLSLFSAVTSASAATTVSKGIYKPTSIGIGTNINISTPDPGVATYVGRDMYIGGKPSLTKTLDAKNAPTGSYAAEAEGLTVVRGKLAMNPIKKSWGGDGFRFGTVGFGSQFRPSEGSTVLAVAGINSWIENMNTGRGGTSDTATVGAWTRGAWVGRSKENTGCDYTAKIAGPITYSYWDRDTNNGRQSVVKKQGNWFEGSDALKSDLFNQNVDLTNVNNNDYSKYNGADGYLSKLSKQLASFADTGKVGKVTDGLASNGNNYVINKYDNKGTSYTLTFDGSEKSVSGALDTRIPNYKICNTERLITFTGDGTSMQQVFTIAGSELSNLKDGVYYRGVDFKFEKIPEGASVIVNVTGNDPVEFHNGWRFWWGEDEISRGYESQYAGKELGTKYSLASQSIMWNFVDTTSLTIRGGIAGEGRKDWGGSDDKWTDDDPAAAMIGSILVPNGSFDDHVTTNGRVYVGVDFSMNSPKVAAAFGEGNSASVIDMDQERHNFPWSGSYTPDGSSIAWSKVDAADGTKLLPGSSWTIYGTVDDAKNGTNPIVTVTDGTSTDSASTAGELQFNYLNQKANIGDPNDTDYFTYYIKEVTAPAGYQKSDTIYYAKMKNTGEKVNYVQGYVDENGKEILFSSTNTKGAITNTKKVKPVTLEGKTYLKGAKVLTGRDGVAGDTFTFEISSSTGAPLPSKRTATVDYQGKDAGTRVPFNFGDIEYKLPGTYTYTVIEKTVDILGVFSSQAAYNIVVPVKDDGTGQLKVDTDKIKVYLTSRDDGTTNAKGDDQSGTLHQEVDDGTAVFTNVFDADSEDWTPSATKVLTDNSGARPLKNGMFTFQIKAVGENKGDAPLPKGMTVQHDADGNPYVTVANIGESVSFGSMAFTGKMAAEGKTFTYQISEVNGGTHGVTYSTTVYTAKVRASLEADPQDASKTIVKVIATYTDDAGATVADSALKFENSYTPDSTTLEGATALGGTKTLTGRDQAAGDDFTFTLTPSESSKATQKAVTEGWIKLGDDGATSLTTQVIGAKNGVASPFSFGKVTFTHPGVYVFDIKETVPDQNANGMTWDRRTGTATVKVTDTNGALSASVNYAGNAFTNKYEKGSVTLKGDTALTVQKTFTGRESGWGENDKFGFTVEKVSFDNKTGKDDLAKMPDVSGVSIGKPADGGTVNTAALGGDDGVTFEQAGTYVYKVKETKGNLGGVTYDGHEATVTIVVSETAPDGTYDGNLHATVTYDNSAATTDADKTVTTAAAFTNTYADRPQKKTVGTAKNPKTSIDGKLVGVSDELVYTINWVNDAVDEKGGAAKAKVVVTDTLPTGVDFKSADPKPTKQNGQTLTFDLGEKDANATGTITIKVKVNASAATTENGELSNKATIQLGGNKATTNPVTNHVPVKTETTNPGTIRVGQTLNYQIQFTADADGTTKVVDTLSKGLTYTANSARVNGTAFETIVNGQKLAWNVPTTVGQTYTITFSVTVTEDAADSVNNTATVGGHSSNTVTTPQEQPGTLTISKTVTVEDNQGIDADAAKDKAFTFTVALKDRSGNALTKSYNYTGTGVADGTITDGGTVTLKDGQSIQIAGLPAGAKYTVTEAKVDGYTPDPVSGERTGTIEKDAASTAVFTNHYKVSEVKLDGATNLKVTKKLTGRDWQAGDEFAFVLAADTTDDATKAAVDAGNIKLPDNATDITIKNDTADHQAAFGDITFKQAGTFKFTITEEQGGLGGIAYDTTPKTVTVKVTDQGDGTLKAEATEGANPTITNTYGTVVPGDEAAKTDVEFTKEFNGWSDADGSFNNTNFNFTLKAVTEGAPLPKKDDGTDNTTATVSKPASGTSATFRFGTINFTYDMVKDAPNKTKTFTYEVTEDMPQGADDGKLNGITYDTGKATVKITVTDKNGNGRMGVTVNVDKATFTNTYQAAPVTVDANDALAGTKVLNAVNSDKKLAKDDFSFTAEAIDNTTVVPTTTTATNEAPTTEGSNTGAFNFGSLTFTQAGTYTYKVTEDKGGTKADGCTYDGSVYTVTFTVTDNKQGKLVATRAITKGNEAKDAIVFTNTYEPTSVSTDAAGTLGGKKIVQASDGNSYELQAGDFSFQLTPGAKAPGKVQTVQNKEDGTYAFDPIPFTSAGTYSYTVSEVQATKGGFTFDGASYGVTFTVEDQNGALKITNTQVQRVEGDNKADGKLGELNFTNKYDPKATSYTLSGTKVLESTDPSAQRALKDGEFTFQLTPINGTTGDVQTTTNTATGVFSFGTLNYTAPGAYTYEVRELAGKDSTITYDTNTVYTVTVTVEDRDGVLTVTNVAGVPVDGIVFKNTYTPNPVTVDPTAGGTKIGGTKTLIGRDAKAGEFTYELVDGFGTVVDTATSGDAKDGKAAAWTFAKKLEFTKTGTYRYTVREASGGTTAAGVTYDATAFGVTITVTEDADAHALRAQVTATKDGAEAPIAFANSYAAAPATVGFKAGKVLTGKDLTAGQFSFKLTGDGVNLTAKNDAGGGVDFGTLTFKQAGTYIYQVSEVDDGQANVTYDDTAYKVVVTVADHGTGQLQAQVTYDNDAAPVFQNSYAEPPKDDGKTDEQPPSKERPKTKIKKEQLAKTGDDTMIGVVASLVAAIGAIGAGVALHLKGRR